MFWLGGQPATEGMRAMAERGRTAPLDLDVAAAIATGNARAVLSGSDLGRSPGMVTLDFEVAVTHPLVTLVTMVAPGPDWFIGVSGLPLMAKGQWLDSLSVPLYPWDAGTDSGATYKAEDIRTLPAEPIRRLLGFPVAVAGAVPPLGTLTFTRQR